MSTNMEQHGEKIKHVKPIASDARNGETCTTPEIVWFELSSNHPEINSKYLGNTIFCHIFFVIFGPF